MKAVQTHFRRRRSGSALFIYRKFYAIYNKCENIHQKTLTTRNELIQIIRVDKSTSQKRIIKMPIILYRIMELHGPSMFAVKAKIYGVL